MQSPSVGLEDLAAVAFGTLATNMVAEPAGSTGHLRGSELAQALSHAASMAGGEVFKEHAGLSQEAKEIAISVATGLAAKAIGAVCSRSRKLPDKEAQDGRAQAEHEVNVHGQDKQDEDAPPDMDIEMTNMSPSPGNNPLRTPKAKPEQHSFTTSPIKEAKSDTSGHSLERMELGMNT